MAYEIYAFPRMDANHSVTLQHPLQAMYPQDYDGYDYNYTFESPELGVFPQVHISAKILVGITYCLMMSICGIGNLLLCYVIYRFRRMRTTTNLLIGNLALSDFLVAVICAPFNFYFYLFQNWPFGSAMCLAVGYLKITSLYVSTNSLLAIAIDR
ncbi:prokineticin receptor 2-like [Patiria miniata]|uniref:G-protein coupled receptors family 1 profile domain-containing protein n=1 Tax=Patiria miniata TaxID=46514 RepID=A0A913Z6S2_PATMI|nr:prokineticin receptor 2-like [Patiria miniata]